MSSRGPFYQGKRPPEWTDWSRWRWSKVESMYIRSREDTTGNVEWQTSTDGRTIVETQPRSQPPQPFQEPQYSPPGSPFDQSSSQYRSSAYSSSANTRSPVAQTNSIVGSTNRQYPTTSLGHLYPQVSDTPINPPSSILTPSSRACFATIDTRRESNTSSSISYSADLYQPNYDYYQQKASHSYTSRAPTAETTRYASSGGFSTRHSYLDDGSRKSPPSVMSGRTPTNNDFVPQNLAEELDDMTVSPSLPPSGSWYGQTKYNTPANLYNSKYNLEPEDDGNEDEEEDDTLQTERERRQSSTTSTSLSNKPSNTKKNSKSSSRSSFLNSFRPASRAQKKDDSKTDTTDVKRGRSSKSKKPTSGVLDKKFCIEPSTKFRSLEVFMMLWTEPMGYNGQSGQYIDSGDDLSMITESKFGEKAYSSIRRFVVVIEKSGHSLCLPILTYKKQGTLKSGVKQEEHAVIYTGDTPPAQLEGEESIYKKPIRMVGLSARDKLDPTSRINYSKIYTVEHNVKVRFIGYIHPDSEAALMTDYQRSVEPPRFTRSTK